LTKAYQELAAKNAKNVMAAIQALSAVRTPAEFELQQRLYDMSKIGEILENFLELPEVGIVTFLGGRRQLVLALHPDGESLGCGGLIAAACNTGLVPAVVVLTNGAASHPP
jgi:hypothetical protein